MATKLVETGVMFPDGSTQSTAYATTTAAPAVNVQTFNSTGTWTKPTGDYRTARIQCWGGGGGGSRASSAAGGAGGGGGYFELTVPIKYLAATVTATVGAGGTGRTSTNGSGGNGGLTSFALATAWNGISSVTGGGGGGGGINGDNREGGGGGSRTSANGHIPGTGYSLGNTSLDEDTPAINMIQSFAILGSKDFGGFRGEDSWFGGGGGAYQIITGGSGASNAGSSIWGGGGGGAGGRAGGRSYYGGAGGTNSAGVAPAGGGSNGANSNGFNGAAGRIIVTCW